MTKKDIEQIDHLAINEEEGLFYHIHVEDGYMLTTWNVGEDIETYSAFDCAYMPLDKEFMNFRVISKEEHEILENQRKEKTRKTIETLRKQHI